MAIKTFNIDQEVHKLFSEHCKDYGISMSKQIELFMRSQIATSSEERKIHTEKIDKLRKTPGHLNVNDFANSL